MSDTLADDPAFRTLNMVDDFSRECVAIGSIDRCPVRARGPGARAPPSDDWLTEGDRAGLRAGVCRPCPRGVFPNRLDAKVSIEAWPRHYNEVRPHSSLSHLTPAAFKAKHVADVAGGRSPAMPARADRTTEERTNGPARRIPQ